MYIYTPYNLNITADSTSHYQHHSYPTISVPTGTNEKITDRKYKNIPAIFDIIDWDSFDIVFQSMFAMGCIQLFKMEHIMLPVMIQKKQD